MQIWLHLGLACFFFFMKAVALFTASSFFSSSLALLPLLQQLLLHAISMAMQQLLLHFAHSLCTLPSSSPLSTLYAIAELHRRFFPLSTVPCLAPFPATLPLLHTSPGQLSVFCFISVLPSHCRCCGFVVAPPRRNSSTSCLLLLTPINSISHRRCSAPASASSSASSVSAELAAVHRSSHSTPSTLGHSIVSSSFMLYCLGQVIIVSQWQLLSALHCSFLMLRPRHHHISTSRHFMSQQQLVTLLAGVVCNCRVFIFLMQLTALSAHNSCSFLLCTRLVPACYPSLPTSRCMKLLVNASLLPFVCLCLGVVG